jgi:hypothetical protein
MGEIVVKELGEYVPGKFNSLNLNKIKEFITVPYYIEWYRTEESKKIFPLILQELSDLNPTNFKIPGMITRNPFFDHARIKYFIAYKNQKPAGRIAAFVDYNYKEEGNRTVGWVGLFESIEDSEVAGRLFDKAIEYLKKNSCKRIIGPGKFNAAGEVGLLIKGFENSPYFMEPYNAPYYKEFFDVSGFKKENDWYSISTDNILSGDYMNKISRLSDKIMNSRRSEKFNSYIIRNIDFSNLEREIEVIRNLYNPIWDEGSHPQQVYMTDKEFYTLATGLREITTEEMVFIVEKENEPVAISVNLPDINEAITYYDLKNPSIPGSKILNFRDIKRDLSIFISIKKRLKHKNFSRMRFLILGIKKDHRKNGIDFRLYWMIKKAAMEMGITHGSASQMADVNIDIVNPIFKLGKIAFTWRVYSLDI